jgi:hypothetical protein
MPLIYVGSGTLLKTKMRRIPLFTYACGWGPIFAMIFVPHIDFVAWFMD